MKTRNCRNCKYGKFREDVGYYCSAKDEVFLSIDEYTEKNKCKKFRLEHDYLKISLKIVLSVGVMTLLLMLL